jgi:peptidyl-dipeptidase Dcp
VTLVVAACSQHPAASSTGRANPFFTKSTLAYEAPPFDRIQNGDYRPAIDSGIKLQLAAVRTIADNPAPPTFDNTLVALEKSGALLSRVSQVFNAVTGANTNDTLQKVAQVEAPRFAAQRDAIYLDSALYQRVQASYDACDTLKLDPESKRLVEWEYNRFVHAGAKLSSADKTKLRALNEEESTLGQAFTDKLLAATKAGGLVVDDSASLAGLSGAEAEASAMAAKDRGLGGKWLIPLQNTTQQPALQSLGDRATREELFNASWTRAEKGDSNDTRATIQKLAQLRAQKAQLLGFPSYSAWVLADQMARTPATVLKFVCDLVPAATAKARAEGGAIQAMIRTDGQTFNSSHGTGNCTPSRFARRNSTSTRARSSRTSSSTACSRTACSTRRTNFTA